jgi:hypothetical protein
MIFASFHVIAVNEQSQDLNQKQIKNFQKNIVKIVACLGLSEWILFRVNISKRRRNLRHVISYFSYIQTLDLKSFDGVKSIFRGFLKFLCSYAHISRVYKDRLITVFSSNFFTPALIINYMNKTYFRLDLI